MRRALMLGLVACVAALAVVVAPALSLERYRPEPVEFSMPAADVLGNPDPEAGVVSEPFRAPGRFNMVGLTWRPDGDHDEDDAHAADHGHGPRLAVRTRLDGGGWTDWEPVQTHAEDGPDPELDEDAPRGMANPVWAGEADWVQYRSSEALAGAELHFLNTAGTATTADRVETALRGAASSAAVTLGGVFDGDIADAARAQPDIVSRAKWGASKCKPRTGPVYGEVKAAYVHHTVNLNDYSRSDAAQIVLGICLYHRNTNGWNDIGYNFLVDRFGTIYEGRAGGMDAAVTAAQAEGFNSLSTGIANIGTFTSVKQSTAALDAMASLIRWKLPLHGVPTTGTTTLRSAGGGTNRYPSGTRVRVQRVLGHRDTNATACPGDALYDQLPDLRRRVAGAQPVGTATDVVAAIEARRATVEHGEDLPVSGTLTAAPDGAPIAGQPVDVQALVDGRWRTSSTPITGADGSFAATLSPRRNGAVRVRFAGAGELSSSVTASLTFAVRPKVKLVEPPMSAERGERVRLRGRVSPRMRRVVQVLRLGHGAGFRKVGAKRLKVGRRGFFRGGFVPAGRGLFRVYVVAKPTSTRARGASEKFDVAVGVPVSARSRARARARARRQARERDRESPTTGDDTTGGSGGGLQVR